MQQFYHSSFKNPNHWRQNGLKKKKNYLYAAYRRLTSDLKTQHNCEKEEKIKKTFTMQMEVKKEKPE